MYKIKQKPEDFVVEEVIDLKLDPKGDFVYFWLTKIGYNTVSLVKRIGDFVHVKQGRVGFAGAKDKHAVTKQAISIRDPRKVIGKDTFRDFCSDRIRLEYIGRGKEPISLGSLSGNRFVIIVESDKVPEKVDWIVDYFDDQRFSINNHVVGKAMIQKDWKKAAEEIIEERVKSHLKSAPHDYVGALKRLPIKTLLMYVHAFQSFIWNECAKRYIRLKYADHGLIERRYSIGKVVFPDFPVFADSPLSDSDLEMEIPIVGFGTEYADPIVEKIVHDVLGEQGVSERDFIVPAFPELSCDGGSRSLFVKLSDFRFEDFGKNKYRLSFFLPSGAYATMVIKRMFGV